MTAFVPPQAPDAVQVVAFVELHESVEEAPLEIVLGVALSDSAGADETVTGAYRVTSPPGPVQYRLNVLEDVRGPVLSDPLSGFVPLHAPHAAQLVAFVDAHVSVDDPPLGTLVGLALNVSVGGPWALAGVAEYRIVSKAKNSARPAALTRGSCRKENSEM